MISFETADDATRTATGWDVRQPVVTLRAGGPFASGWYRIRIRLRTPDTPAIRKRLELRFDSSAEVEIRSWNERLSATLMIHLKEPARELSLKLVQGTGAVWVDRFAVTRVRNAVVAMAAVREKLRLVSAYHCLRPVLWRGAGLVARGQFRSLARKVLNGLADGKVMRPEAYRAAEADAAWWRTNPVPADIAEAIRATCDALLSPKSFAVMLHVAAGEGAYARMAAESVRRQLYPHWELFVVSDAEPVELGEWAAADERVTRLRCEPELALPKVRALCRSERVVELPATSELAEDALYRVIVSPRDEVGLPSSFVPPSPGGSVLSPPPPAGGGLGGRRNCGTESPSPLPWREGGTSKDNIHTPPGKEGTKPSYELTLTAELNGINGYDAVVFALLKGLPAQGIRLYRPPTVKVREDLLPPQLRPRVRTRAATDLQLVVFPPFAVGNFAIDRRTVVYTMWETDELLPRWVRTLNRAARVVVPSEWGAQCFRRCGVTVPIHVVPLGFDPAVYHPIPDGRGSSVCVFGTAGALAAGGMRKNAQHLITLFRQAFPTESDVRFRVKLSPTSPVVEDYSDPRIDVLRASLPSCELANWYRSLTAYVNGSFGEGFGLHLLEAMACGRPLITPNATGLTEFFDSNCGYAVGSAPVPVKNDIYRGNWHQPCDDDIIAAMRRVYRDRAEAEELGRRSAAKAASFTWANCCAALTDTITSLS